MFTPVTRHPQVEQECVQEVGSGSSSGGSLLPRPLSLEGWVTPSVAVPPASPSPRRARRARSIIDLALVRAISKARAAVLAFSATTDPVGEIAYVPCIHPFILEEALRDGQMHPTQHLLEAGKSHAKTTTHRKLLRPGLVHPLHSPEEHVRSQVQGAL